jgi:hypothetical protein
VAAAWSGHKAVVEFLLDHSAEIDRANFTVREGAALVPIRPLLRLPQLFELVNAAQTTAGARKGRRRLRASRHPLEGTHP